MTYIISDTAAIQISESSGVIQNVSNDSVEISNSADFADKFVLFPYQKINFNSALFVRAIGNVHNLILINVANL